MSRAMVKVKARIVKRLPGDFIKLRSRGSLRETGRGKGYMTFEHQGVVGFHLFRQRTKRDGSGDVGSSFVVLAAGIKKQKPFRLKCHAGFRRRVVVDNGSVRSVSCYSGKTQVAKTFLPASALQKVICRIHFCQSWLAGCLKSTFTAGCLLYPIYELHHSGTVSYMGLFGTSDLGFVFYCLHQFCRVGIVYDFYSFRQAFCHSIADSFFTEKKLSCRQFFQVVEKSEIW